MLNCVHQLTRVVCSEPQNDVSIRPNDEGIATHRRSREIRLRNIGIGERATVFGGAVQRLEIVAVQVEGVTAWIEVVDNDLDDFVALEHKWVGICAVYLCVCRRVTSREDGVESRHLGSLVGDIVEEGIVCAVAEVVHDDIELDGLGGFWEQGLLVVGDEGHVIKGGEGVEHRCRVCRFRVVVDEPAGYVIVEVIREGIEEGLFSELCVREMRFGAKWQLTVSMLPTIAKLDEVSFRVVTRKLYR